MDNQSALTVTAKVLRYFKAHKGLAVSKDDIARLIYESDGIAQEQKDAYIRQVVFEIRRIVGENRIGKIVNIRGYGYRYEE